jgi:hypothetical protein
LERQNQLKGLDNNEKDLCIKTQLMVFQYKIQSNSEDNMTIRYDYNYQYNSSIPIFQPVFLELSGFGIKKLKALQKHLKTDGLIDCIHGNTGKVPQNRSCATVNLEIAQLFKSFLLQYSNLHGLPSAELESIIYLPTYLNYTTVYKEFRNYFDLEYESIKPIEYNTFYKLWKQLTPYIKFQTPGTDLCDTCEEFRSNLRATKNQDDQEILGLSMINTS